MRALILVAGLTLLPASAWALQVPAGQTGGPGDQPLMVTSQEPDLSTDAASIDELRHKMQKGKSAKQNKADRARPAQAAEIVAGKPVHDLTGQEIALVQKIEADGVVLKTAAATVKVPLEAFGVNKKGLLMNLTKPQFDTLVEQVRSPSKS